MTQEPCLAVLIDADNVSPAIAERLFEEIARLGDASIRRLYGDFSDYGLKGWAAVAERYAINVQQQHAFTKGKNATDIALVIDAMDLLHGGRVTGFCIVSSDSDFNSLAIRIREHGVPVIGFGETKTPMGFRHACHRFYVMDEWLRSPTANLVALIEKALAGQADAEGWADLVSIGQRMRELEPGFEPKGYNTPEFAKLLRSTKKFEVQPRKGGILGVRPRQS